MVNFPHDKLAVVNVQGKILPFRGSADIVQENTDNADEIVTAIEKYAETYRSIVVDDFQYIMANEFMRRAYEGGWDKFTEIGRHAWDVVDCVRNLQRDVIVYVMCHTDTDQSGFERLKTIGKMLDEKIFLEGMSAIVLKTNVSDGKYSFLTQNSGKDTVKSPADMFPAYAINNDLWYVDQKIREYYGLGNEVSAEDLEKADADVAQEVEKPKTRRNRKRNAEKEEPKETPAEKEEEKEKDAACIGVDEEGVRDTVPFEEVDMHRKEREDVEDTEPRPRRRRRKVAE